VKDSCTHPGRYDELKSILFLIEKIQKNLNEYLDTKRQLFPRFYFLSDDELLSIIGSLDPNHIQGYLQKMFDNILALNFNKLEQNFFYAQGMISLEKEEMNFLNPIECNGKVEIWMSNIEKEMKYSNRWITKEAIFYYRFKQNRLEWMRKYIGMVVLAVNQIWSTWEIEEYVKHIVKQGCPDYGGPQFSEILFFWSVFDTNVQKTVELPPPHFFDFRISLYNNFSVNLIK